MGKGGNLSRLLLSLFLNDLEEQHNNCYMYSFFSGADVNTLFFACPRFTMLFFTRAILKGLTLQKNVSVCICLVLHLYGLIFKI